MTDNFPTIFSITEDELDRAARLGDGWYADAGVSFTMTGKLGGDLFVSYRDQSYDDPRLSDISGWMEKKGYATVADFNGLLCQEDSQDPEAYERNQYIKALTGVS